MGIDGHKHSQGQLNHHANQMNPNNTAHQANVDNRANQLNPNNDRFQGSRGNNTPRR